MWYGRMRYTILQGNCLLNNSTNGGTYMHLIKVKIQKDNNTIKYIKMIREYDSSVSIGDLKKRIDANDAVIVFDLDNRDWIHMENMTEYKMHRAFYSFMQKLIENGAKIELTYEYEVSGYGLCTEKLDMEALDRLIKFNKEIWDEVENNPD